MDFVRGRRFRQEPLPSAWPTPCGSRSRLVFDWNHGARAFLSSTSDAPAVGRIRRAPSAAQRRPSFQSFPTQQVSETPLIARATVLSRNGPLGTLPQESAPVGVLGAEGRGRVGRHAGGCRRPTSLPCPRPGEVRLGAAAVEFVAASERIAQNDVTAQASPQRRRGIRSREKERDLCQPDSEQVAQHSSCWLSAVPPSLR